MEKNFEELEEELKLISQYTKSNNSGSIKFKNKDELDELFNQRYFFYSSIFIIKKALLKFKMLGKDQKN